MDAWLIAVPPVVGLAGVVIGAFLMDWLAGQREKRQYRREWGQLLFEKYEKAYRDFLSGWGGLPVADHLKRNFELLQANSIVPCSIVEVYDETLTILADPNALDAGKRNACNKLRQSFDRFMFQPWSAIANVE